MSWDKYRELLKRLPDRLRTRLGSLEYLRVTHWRRRRPHTHFVAWADATADELRAALKAVLNSFGGGFTEGGPIDRPGSYSVDYIEDVIALVRYVTEDTAEGGELVPEDYTGDTATTSRDFLGHPIKYLDDELKRADLERRYHRWLDRASRGNPKRRQWLARLYPLPPRPIAPPDHPNGRPPGRPDPAVFAAQAAEVEARLNPPRPPPDPPPDDPTDGVPADDNDDSDPEAEGWAELDAFRLEMEADGWSLDDEAAYESYLARAERLGLA